MLKKKTIFWIFLLLPAFILFPLPLIKGLVGKKLWGRELVYSGYIAAGLLFITLMISPMLMLFPKINLFKSLSRYRREIGLSVFIYACFHFLAFLLKGYYKKGYLDLKKIMHPVIFPGFLAFLLLLLLAVTSNNFSVKLMGGRRWKQLHKLAYVVEGLVFLHILLQDPLWAFLIFTPLVLLQGLKIMGLLKNER